jgi:hypothetical protein
LAYSGDLGSERRQVPRSDLSVDPGEVEHNAQPEADDQPRHDGDGQEPSIGVDANGPRKLVETHEIALWIENKKRVTERDELLGDQTREVGLTLPRAAGDEQVELRGSEPDF